MSLATLKAQISRLAEVTAITVGPFRVNAGVETTFTAIQSTAPSGDTITDAVWDWGDGSAPESGLTVTHTYAAEGNYRITMRCVSSAGVYDLDYTSVTVDAAEVLPVADAGGPYTSVEGQVVTFNGAGTTGQNIVEYKWTPGDGGDPVYGISAQYTYADDAGSPYTVTLEVTDANTNTDSDTSTATISAAATNQDPVATLSNSPTTAEVGVSQQYSAQGSNDPDGSIVLLSWDWGDGSPVEEGATYWRRSHTYASTSGSPYTITLTVTDDLGATGQDTLAVTVSAASGATLDWFETAEAGPVEEDTITLPTDFPLIATGHLKQVPSADYLSRVHMTACKFFGSYVTAVEGAQAINSNLMVNRVFSPCVYQGADDGSSYAAGPQFFRTGPITNGDEVFAGHWLYRAERTTVSTFLNLNSTTVYVDDASQVRTGQYACIVNYDGESLDWNTAEHVYVSARNTSLNTITVTRKYKLSTAQTAAGGQTHPVGSLVLNHELWQAADTRAWAFNMSKSVANGGGCPVDGAGLTAAEQRADWIAQHYNKDGSMTPLSCTVTGIQYDSDFIYNEEGDSSRNTDIDLDGTVDSGMGTGAKAGENQHGDGLAAFYERVRTNLVAAGKSNVVQIMGDGKCYGPACHGSQEESFPSDQYSESGNTLTTYYNRIHRGISALRLRASQNRGPIVSDIQSKLATLSYPGTTAADSNADFRLGFCMGLWFGVPYSKQNGYAETIHWYDYYAVDLTPGATYGDAIPFQAGNGAAIRAANSWMGAPVALGYHDYDPEDTSLQWANNLLSDGHFDGATSVSAGWTGTAASAERIATGGIDGGPFMRVTPNTASLSLTDITANLVQTVETISASSGTDLTLAFAVRCANQRKIVARIGGTSGPFDSKQIYIPGDSQWHKHLICFRLGSNLSSQRLTFDVGVDGDVVDFDQVFLTATPVCLYVREFENAISIANPTNAARSITLTDTWQRVNGTQETSIDTGATITGGTPISIPAYDGLVLVRPAA